MKRNNIRSRRGAPSQGFFLTELIISVFIFSAVMTISVGSLVLALDANRKTQSLKSALNNLNVVMDTMTRTIATGQYYYCGDLAVTFPHNIYRDCGAGGDSISFLSNEDLGGYEGPDDVITYGKLGNSIYRTIHLSTGDTIGPTIMTAPEVRITELMFYVSGSTPINSDCDSGCVATGDFDQPQVTLVVKGETESGPRNAATQFSVQTLVSQRVPDFNDDTDL